MGNENSSQQQITYGKNGIPKGTNQIARGILASNVQGIPTDEQIAGALAIQQSQDTGPLKKTDLIAILIRLNPDKNNALLSQYKIEDLLKCIRYEVYVKPFGGVNPKQQTQPTVQSFTTIQDGYVNTKYGNYSQLSQQQLQYNEPLSNNGNIKQLEYRR
jgi:hypothetical protein